MQSTSKAGGAVNPIVRLMLKDGVLKKEQFDYAHRVLEKLHMPRSLCEIVEELGYVTREQILGIVRKYQGKLRIGDLLNGLGYLSDENLREALDLQAKSKPKQKLGDILVQHKFISDERLTEILAMQLDLPVVNLALKDPDNALLAKAPLEYYEQYRFIPCDYRSDGTPRLAFADPLDPRALSAAKDYFGQNIEVCITRLSQLNEILAQRKEAATLDFGETDPSRLNVVEVANAIILGAIRRESSDIHVEPMADKIRVRYRVDGVMVHFRDYPINIISSLVSRFKIMCGADIAEKRRHQDGRLIFNHGNVQMDLRMSFYVTVYGEQVVMRLLKSQEELLPIDKLGMLPRMMERFLEDVLDAPSGVMMVTGPTGSGKSTNVYSCINYLNSPDVSIITAEDPVEYKIRGVAQCSINPSIGLTFEETLKHIVRQDPDIVVIGEIRDNFSASMCIQTALTGHKVLTTFHTEDSIGALVRLLDMDIEPFLVSSTVSCIVAQRLVRRICRHCAVPCQPDLSQLRRLGCTHADLAGGRFMKGRGCDECRHTGYRGRVAVFEMLIPDVHIRDAVIQRKTTHELRQLSLENAGMVTLMEDGLTKAAIGWTTLDEVLRTLPRVQKPRPLSELRRILGA